MASCCHLNLISSILIENVIQRDNTFVDQHAVNSGSTYKSIARAHCDLAEHGESRRKSVDDSSTNYIIIYSYTQTRSSLPTCSANCLIVSNGGS